MALHRFEGHFGPGYAKNGYDLKEITVGVELAEAPGHVVAHTYVANPHWNGRNPALHPPAIRSSLSTERSRIGCRRTTSLCSEPCRLPIERSRQCG